MNNLNINISNPQKIIYPKNKINKLDVVCYYTMVAPFMLSYIKNRPLATIRCHGTIRDEIFFKKHPQAGEKNIKTFINNNDEYFYINSINGIVNQAQMGTIEFHPWACTYNSLNKPNIMIFDLDPAPNVHIAQLREGVINLKQILEELNLTSFLKTSGGKGYHVVVPFSSCKNWEVFSEFSKNIAKIMEQKWPTKYTTNIRKNERDGKIFIDYLRNDKGSTCVAPYSLRARENAPVSMPIFWDELNKIKPNQITLNLALKKIKEPNPWSLFWDVKQSIN